MKTPVRPIHIALIVACTAIGLLILPPRLTPEARHQALNLELVEQHLPDVENILRADDSFQELKAYRYTGLNGSIQIVGNLASDENELILRRRVDELELPVPVLFRLSLGDDPANHRLQLTGDARDMMLLLVCSLLSAGGRQLSLLR